MSASVAMAPKTPLLHNCELEERRYDCNNNDASIESGSKRPSNEGDANERCRKIIKNCFVTLTSNLNVLVIGSKGSGKSVSKTKLT